MSKTKYQEILLSFETRLYDLFTECNGKSVVLWGYGKSGHAIEAAFRRHGKQIDILMDKDNRIHNVERPYILDSYSPKSFIVLIAFSMDDDARHRLSEAGFHYGINYIPLKEFFYGEACTNKAVSFYDWIENAADIDVQQPLKLVQGECRGYEATKDYALLKILDTFCFHKDDRIFDYGCGRGATFCIFEKYGIQWGGIEYNRDLYECCVKNMKTLGLPTSDIYCGDATDYTNIDGYNYFHLFNQFIGDTFRKVIHQIEQSYKRKPRTIILIYSNPFCHKIVLEDGIFQCSKKIQADYFIKNVNIYRIEAVAK